ncbi:MAG: 4Fe-4S binding protein [Synergistaceae bacterium]|nr:4Fe-4S binding protein [Synergistaceae bacterium]
MKKSLQRTIQFLFLAFFIFLIVQGKVQLWMGLFLAGIIASFVLGRVYCGWLCSINTAMIYVTWIKKKLHIKSMKIPSILTRPWVRYAMLSLFVIFFVITMVTGKRLPVLPIFFVVGMLLTFLFPEELWHRYLCPYGTILHIPAKASRFQMSIDPDKCNNCGVCLRVCPAKAVEKLDNNHEIHKNDCLVCMECSRKCKQEAIKYKTLK